MLLATVDEVSMAVNRTGTMPAGDKGDVPGENGTPFGKSTTFPAAVAVTFAAELLMAAATFAATWAAVSVGRKSIFWPELTPGAPASESAAAFWVVNATAPA